MRAATAGLLSATASLGLIHLWDVDVGLTQVDKYLYSSEDMIKVRARVGERRARAAVDGSRNDTLYTGSPVRAPNQAGALLAVGIISASIRSEFDPALSLLSEPVNSDKPVMAQAAIAGLGIAYAGHDRSDVLELLEPAIGNASLAVQTSALAALAAGMVGVATCSRGLAEAIVSTLLDRDGEKLRKEPLYRFFPLGLALLYLGTLPIVQPACGRAECRG